MLRYVWGPARTALASGSNTVLTGDPVHNLTVLYTTLQRKIMLPVYPSSLVSKVCISRYI